jgi:hypothetical protein
MEKQKLCFCSLLLAIFLMTGTRAMAQKDTTMWMTMLEYRVHDESVFEKNYPIVKAWWLKTDAGIEYGRAAHTSESGRVYSLALFKGVDNLGAFIATRVKNNDAFNAANPAVSKENLQNINGAISRSIWMRVDSLSHYEPGYKMEDFDFRKIQLLSITADKIKEFQAGIITRFKLDASHDIRYNFIVYHCTDGYPSNTYLIIVPDKSILDYYKNFDVRKTKRAQFKSEYDPIRKLSSDIVTVARIDHLTRVK